MPPQAEQIACPGEPTAVSDSATWYLAPQAEQEISYILITNSHRLERPLLMITNDFAWAVAWSFLAQ
jgi:hypothetical protein